MLAPIRPNPLSSLPSSYIKPLVTAIPVRRRFCRENRRNGSHARGHGFERMLLLLLWLETGQQGEREFVRSLWITEGEKRVLRSVNIKVKGRAREKTPCTLITTHRDA